LPFSCPRKQENAYPGVSCSNFPGGRGACPRPTLDTWALSGLENIPTYFTATGDNLYATAASKLNDSPDVRLVIKIYLLYVKPEWCRYSLPQLSHKETIFFP